MNKAQIALQNLLKEERSQKGFSQQELAKKTGFAQSVISKYESGERKLTIMELISICEALDISLSYFTTKLETRLRQL